MTQIAKLNFSHDTFGTQNDCDFRYKDHFALPLTKFAYLTNLSGFHLLGTWYNDAIIYGPFQYTSIS